MALDLRGVNAFPYFDTATTDGSSNDLTEIQLPDAAVKVSLMFVTNAGKISHTGTDGAAIGADFAQIPADQYMEINRRGRDKQRAIDSLFITSATGGTTFYIVLEGA